MLKSNYSLTAACSIASLIDICKREQKTMSKRIRCLIPGMTCRCTLSPLGAAKLNIHIHAHIRHTRGTIHLFVLLCTDRLFPTSELLSGVSLSALTSHVCRNASMRASDSSWIFLEGVMLVPEVRPPSLYVSANCVKFIRTIFSETLPTVHLSQPHEVMQ